MEETQPVIYEKGQLYTIPLSDLRPDPNQPRKFMDPTALEELTASIKEHGVLVPILFRQNTDDGALYIVAGERRFAAAQNAGLTTIPAMFVEGNTSEIALIENLQRQDLTCIEEAEALKRLMEEEKYTQDQLAAVIGKPRATITETLSLTNLPQEIRDECRGDRKMGKKRLVEISRKKQQRAMITAYAKYKEELQKEQEGSAKKREKLTAAAAFCQSLDKSREKVQNTDVADWSEDDHLAADDSIGRLREALNNFTTPPGMAMT